MLASHLINLPDDDAALQLLRTCSRHVSRHGQVLIERRSPAWFDVAEAMEIERDGIVYRLSDIDHDRTWARATLVNQ